jgi:hypothetical protein
MQASLGTNNTPPALYGHGWGAEEENSKSNRRLRILFEVQFNLFNMTFMFRVLDGLSSPIYMVTRSRNWSFVITNLTNIIEGNVRYPAEGECFSASIRYWSTGRIVCWCHFLVSVVINFSRSRFLRANLKRRATTRKWHIVGKAIKGDSANNNTTCRVDDTEANFRHLFKTLSTICWEISYLKVA